MDKTLASCTFAVSDVETATGPLREVPYREAVASFLRGPVESCSRYRGKLVADVVWHPLIAALQGAFTSHRPLTLSPDIIWLTITQGLAIHINQNAERLRHRFVSHDGKLTIKIRRDDFIKGSPENPWPEVFSAFSEKIRDHIGDAYDLIVADFSTTGAVERAAYEVVLLDSMQSYFQYELQTLCGIPSITLEGTVEDWQSITSRAERLSEFGLDWWIDPLVPILNRFIEAAAGNVDQGFWDSIYKFHGSDGSGSPTVSGWVATLFPYLQGWEENYIRNRWVKTTSSREGPSPEDFPKTASKAPFKWEIRTPRVQAVYDMEFIGGLIGVAQQADTLRLRPEIGWAVREVGESKASG